MILVPKLIFPTHRGGPTGSCESGGRSGKSGKMRGKWGKIPVRDFYFLSRGFIFNSAGLKLSENEISINTDFSHHRGGPTGSCGKGKVRKIGKNEGEMGQNPRTGFLFSKSRIYFQFRWSETSENELSIETDFSHPSGRPYRLLRIRG